MDSKQMTQPPPVTQETRPVETARLEAKWWILLAIGVGSFMTALDGSVVNIILPVVSRAFNSDVASVEWVVTVYLLVVSSLLLSFGRLGDMRGHKLVYISGFLVFVVSSALCGLASSIGFLIIARALQALGGAMLLANSPAILTKNFPAQQRGQVLGLQATMTYLGLTVGPSLGGWLTSQYGWRAVFYINLPVGLLALLLSLYFIPLDAGAERAERFDLVGAITFMAGLVALLLGLNQGHAWGWSSPAILGLLAAAVVLLTVFVFIERRVSSPMLDLTLFRVPLFSASTASAVFNYICLFTGLFLLPFYLIQARGLSPAQAGLILTAQPVLMAIMAPLSGTLSDRMGARLLSTLGMGVMALGLFLLAQVQAASPLSYVALSLATVGFGTGVFISPNTSALLGAAPLHRRGIASGIMATARNMGMVLGVGLAGAVFTTVQAQAQVAGSATATYEGIRAGFMVAVGVALVGVLTSAIRGPNINA
ncbi:MAG: MFS transporter [Chloroflexota bacterium]|nr:MAG: MFS transporter [Chloroflexota bacterium]